MKSAEKDNTRQRNNVQLINRRKLYSTSYMIHPLLVKYFSVTDWEGSKPSTRDLWKSFKFADIIKIDVNCINVDRKRDSSSTVPYGCFGRVGENGGRLLTLCKGKNTQSTARKHVLSKNTNSTQRVTTASWRISAVKIPSHLSRNRQNFNECETLINSWGMKYHFLAFPNYLLFTLLCFRSLGRDMECNDESRNVRKYTP